jgi:hypothetical protein
MMRFVRGGVLVVAFAGTLFLPACDEAVAPPLVPTPPQTVRAVVFTSKDEFTNFQPGLLYYVPIPLGQAGSLDFTVDWTFTNTYLIVAFGRQLCTFEELDGGKCPFILRTEGSTPKPLIIATPPLSTATYYFYMYSQPWDTKLGYGSDAVESLALQIGLTVGPTATPAAAPIEPVRLQPRLISQ